MTRLRHALAAFLLLQLSTYTYARGLETIEVSDAAKIDLKERVKHMFYHGYDSYMNLAFPKDDLRPITCDGHDTWGGYSLTLIDSLDTLLVMGNHSEFQRGVRYVIENIQFDRDVNVSVFETNIRVLGGLLSAHLLIEHNYTSMPDYKGELLALSIDLGNRLLPAFETETGIPYGTVNLMYGVPPKEVQITCTAGAGTFALEFGLLSKITGNPIYEEVAKKSALEVWNRRSSHGLVGNHIDISTGAWTYRDAGIGHGIDSYFEYNIKAAIYFNDDDYLSLWNDSYPPILRHLKKGPFYVEADINSANPNHILFNGLQAFFPGVQALSGDLQNAIFTARAFHQIWRQHRFVPEKLDLTSGRASNPEFALRPEHVESVYILSRAFPKSSEWISYGRDIVESFERYTTVECGHAAIKNVGDMSHMNRMDSFFLAETCKYMYLLFDDGNFINKGNFIFNTEAHPYPISTRYLQQPQGPPSSCPNVPLFLNPFPDTSNFEKCMFYPETSNLDRYDEDRSIDPHLHPHIVDLFELFPLRLPLNGTHYFTYYDTPPPPEINDSSTPDLPILSTQNLIQGEDSIAAATLDTSEESESLSIETLLEEMAAMSTTRTTVEVLAVSKNTLRKRGPEKEERSREGERGKDTRSVSYARFKEYEEYEEWKEYGEYKSFKEYLRFTELKRTRKGEWKEFEQFQLIKSSYLQPEMEEASQNKR